MKRIKTIFGILSVFFALLTAAVFLTEKYSNFSFLIGTVNSNILTAVFASCAVICLLASAITAIVSKSERRIVLNSVIRFLCICVIGCFSLTSASDNKDLRYYEFSSPDGKHTVIAEEWSFLLGGGINFYERINPLLVTYKDNFNTDDGYRAISSGDYSVEWNENVMSFTSQNGNRIYQTIKIKL